MNDHHIKLRAAIETIDEMFNGQAPAGAEESDWRKWVLAIITYPFERAGPLTTVSNGVRGPALGALLQEASRNFLEPGDDKDIPTHMRSSRVIDPDFMALLARSAETGTVIADGFEFYLTGLLAGQGVSREEANPDMIAMMRNTYFTAAFQTFLCLLGVWTSGNDRNVLKRIDEEVYTFYEEAVLRHQRN